MGLFTFFKHFFHNVYIFLNCLMNVNSLQDYNSSKEKNINVRSPYNNQERKKYCAFELQKQNHITVIALEMCSKYNAILKR